MAKWTREVPQRHLARPLAPPHAHMRPRLLPEPPRHPRPAPRHCSSARSPSCAPDPNRPPPVATSLARSPLAYKNSQSSTVAPLLPLLPPPAAPPWPPRSRSRGPASPAPHCPLRPPQQLRHLLVTLHARAIEPKPPPNAVPLLRRRRRAQAHRGPASSEGDRARQLPQKHP